LCLDGPAASVSQERIEPASHLKIVIVVMTVVRYLDRLHGMPNAGDVAASRQLLKPILAEAASICGMSRYGTSAPRSTRTQNKASEFAAGKE
jgi:hypothetical protein